MSKLLKFLALLLLALLIFWWFGRNLNWLEVRHSLGQAHWELLLVAVMIVFFTYLIRAYRWRALLAPFTHADLKDLFVATIAGFSAVFLIGRAAEAVRPAILPLRDRRVRPAASFVTIMVERICDLVAIVLLFAVNLAWFISPIDHEVDFAHIRQVGMVLLMATLAGLATLILFERHASALIHWVDQRVIEPRFIPKRLGRFFIEALQQLAAGLRVLANPKELMVTCFWTALLWSAIVIANLIIIRAFGVQFGFRETVFMLGWALVGSTVPTPGGAAGAFHAATAASLVFLGVKHEQAAAISIFVHLVDFAPALVLGFYYLLSGDISFGHVRRLTSTKIVDVPPAAEAIETT